MLSVIVNYILVYWSREILNYVLYLIPIKILYKHCTRLLSYEYPYAHTPPIALQLGLLIFDDLFTYFSSINMFKIANYKPPLCISCLFQCLHGSTCGNT